MRIAQPLFFLLLLMFAALCSHAQQEQRNFGIAEVFRGGDSIFIKKLRTVVINVSDGLVTKQDTSIDSARLFLSSDGALYQGTTVWRKVGGTVPPPVFVTEKVDGERATFSTSPLWSLHGITTAATWYGVPNPTIAYSNVVGSSVSYTFTGTKIELWGERKPNDPAKTAAQNHGNGTVSIDNGAAQPVTFVGPSALPVLIYSSPDLPLGSHTIRLSVVSGYNLIDYFLIHKPQ